MSELEGKKVILEAMFSIHVQYLTESDGSKIRIETINTSGLEIRDPSTDEILAIYNGKTEVSPYGADLNSSRIVKE